MRRRDAVLRRDSIELKSLLGASLKVGPGPVSTSLQYRICAGQCNIAPAFPLPFLYSRLSP